MDLLRLGSIQAGDQFNRMRVELKIAFPLECEQLRQQIKLYNFDAALATLSALQLR